MAATKPIDPNLPKELWHRIAVHGMPLRGWHEIAGALEKPNTRSLQARVKRLNKESDGPIVYVRNKPEAHREQLLAWIGDIEERARKADDARASTDAARKELEERKGARQQDYKFHTEARPNARGKARGNT